MSDAAGSAAQQWMIATVRRAIEVAHPELVESVKWNAPNWSLDGVDRVTLRLPPRGGLQVILHRGVAVRADAAGFRFDVPAPFADDRRLAWPAPDRGVLTLADETDTAASSGAITDLVRAWLAVA